MRTTQADVMPTRASRSGCRSRGQPDLGERQQGGQFPRLLRFRHKESEATVAVRNPARGDKSPRCLQAKPCRAGLGILPDVSKRRWLGGGAPKGLCRKAARSFELRACGQPSPYLGIPGNGHTAHEGGRHGWAGLIAGQQAGKEGRGRGKARGAPAGAPDRPFALTQTTDSANHG